MIMKFYGGVSPELEKQMEKLEKQMSHVSSKKGLCVFFSCSLTDDGGSKDLVLS